MSYKQQKEQAMEIYNPTKTVTLMNVIRDLYWNNKAVRISVDGIVCVLGIVTLAMLAVVLG